MKIQTSTQVVEIAPPACNVIQILERRTTQFQEIASAQVENF